MLLNVGHLFYLHGLRCAGWPLFSYLYIKAFKPLGIYGQLKHSRILKEIPAPSIVNYIVTPVPLLWEHGLTSITDNNR